jgi:hypothetical protein
MGLVFERNTSTNQSFQGGEKLILFQEAHSAELKKHMYLSICVRIKSI